MSVTFTHLSKSQVFHWSLRQNSTHFLGVSTYHSRTHRRVGYLSGGTRSPKTNFDSSANGLETGLVCITLLKNTHGRFDFSVCENRQNSFVYESAITSQTHFRHFQHLSVIFWTYHINKIKPIKINNWRSFLIDYFKDAQCIAYFIYKQTINSCLSVILTRALCSCDARETSLD